MKKDRRIEKTEQALRQAFLELCAERGYEKLSVSQIASRANVGRTTFYAHYSDKEELLTNSLSTMFDDLINNMESDGRDTFAPAYGLFDHVSKNTALDTAFDIDFICNKFQVEIVHAVKRLSRKSKGGGLRGTRLDIRAEVIGGGLIALVRWWLTSGRKQSAEEMGERFYAAFGSG